MASLFNFEQVKINPNEIVNNSTINRGLLRLWKCIENIGSTNTSFPQWSTDSGTNRAILIKNGADGDMFWEAESTFANKLPKSSIFELTDVLNITPDDGQTLIYDSDAANFKFKKLPTNLNDLEKVSISENPSNNAVFIFSQEENKWVDRSVSGFIGVGYIMHIICSSPTIVKLPTDTVSLSGGEQVVITRVKSNNNTSDPVPVMALANDTYPMVTGHVSMISDNAFESYSTIHLRAAKNENNKIVWVPVAGVGTWKPSTKISLDVPATIRKLTSNDLKLQPYNLDVSLLLGENSISETFNVSFINNVLVDDNENVSYENGIITIKNNIFNGQRLVNAKVYWHDTNDNKRPLKEIMPDEIFFPDASNYSYICIDVSSWIALDNPILKFKINLSI